MMMMMMMVTVMVMVMVMVMMMMMMMIIIITTTLGTELLALRPCGLRSTPQVGWIGFHMPSIRFHCHYNNNDEDNDNDNNNNFYLCSEKFIKYMT